MNKAQELVRMVARAFYDTEAVVIVDALVRHGTLSHSDIQYIFQNSARGKGQISHHLGQLKLGGLIRESTRSETKANAQKPTQVAYYWIDYRHAVDATKYRLHTLGSQLRKRAGPAEEKKEYRCPRCKAEYRELDVISDSLGAFTCLQCGHALDYVEQDAEDAEATGPVGAFNRSLGWLIALMQDIDRVAVPAATFDAAFASRVEIPRPRAPLEGPKLELPSAPGAGRPAAVKGLANGPQHVEVSILSETDNTAAAQIAAAEQKERLAAQNALPEWHTRSTVSNEMTAAGQREEAARREREAEMGVLTAADADEKKVVGDDGLEDIWAKIETEERLKREQEEMEEDDEEEDEDEELELEDVPVAAVGANGDGSPGAKRVRMEVDTPVSQATGSGDAEDSEEEFEDV